MGRRADSDEHYVLDLCDEVIGVRGERQATFLRLVGDVSPTTGLARRLPVDGYWPTLGLVVEFQEKQDGYKDLLRMVVSADGGAGAVDASDGAGRVGAAEAVDSGRTRELLGTLGCAWMVSTVGDKHEGNTAADRRPMARGTHELLAQPRLPKASLNTISS